MTTFDPTAESGSEEEKPQGQGKLKEQKQALKVLDVRQFTVSPDDDDIRIDRWFKRHMEDVPFNVVSRWSRTGQLRLDGKRVSPGDRVNAGHFADLSAITLPYADAIAQQGIIGGIMLSFGGTIGSISRKNW